MTEIREFDALQITPTEHQLVVPFGRLAEVLRDPDIERPRGGKALKPVAPPTPWEAEHTRLQVQLQRPFLHLKKKNVPSYRSFIAAVLEGTTAGDMPEVTLWAGATTLPTERTPCGVRLQVDPQLHIIAIDGETQLAARFDLLREAVGMWAPVVVRLHHGIPLASAQQIFYNRNVLGVEVPVAFGLTRDHTDPIIEAARPLAEILGPSLVSESQTNRLSLHTLKQAFLWGLHRRTREAEFIRKAGTFPVDLARVGAHLEERLHDLRPRMLADRLLQRPAVFIAATDVRVGSLHLDALDPTEAFWGTVRAAEAEMVAAVVEHLLQRPLVFDAPGSHVTS